MATPSPNWNLAKSKLPSSQAIPNGDIYVDVRLKTTLPGNPRGYLQLFPDATKPEKGSLLQYAVQSNGKVTFRAIDEDGKVRRQFNNIQELADSGYNVGFPINATTINVIKTNLNDRLISGTQEKIISTVGAAAGAATTVYTGPTSPLTLETELGVEEFTKSLYKYPLSTIDNTTDYILINVKKYTPVGISLVRARGSFNSPEQKTINQNAIILPMPSNIQDGNSVSYADGSLDGITAVVADYALNTMQLNLSDLSKAGEKMSSDTQEVLRKLGDAKLKDIFLRGLAAQAASIPGVGNITKEQILARESGGILNPNMELLFNGVALRSFKFSFKLTPRNGDEAREIKDIIRILKINMAPKVVKENNTFLSTPNVFDLQYMQGNKPHPFLHRFKTCALTDMSVNYTGEGIYATYSDATPNSMIMDLSFKELEPIFDSDYKGVGGVGY